MTVVVKHIAVVRQQGHKAETSRWYLWISQIPLDQCHMVCCGRHSVTTSFPLDVSWGVAHVATVTSQLCIVVVSYCSGFMVGQLLYWLGYVVGYEYLHVTLRGSAAVGSPQPIAQEQHSTTSFPVYNKKKAMLDDISVWICLLRLSFSHQ